MIVIDEAPGTGVAPRSSEAYDGDCCVAVESADEDEVVGAVEVALAVVPSAIAVARIDAAPTLMPVVTTRLVRKRRLRISARARRAGAPKRRLRRAGS